MTFRRGDKNAPYQAEPADDEFLISRAAIFDRDVEILVDEIDVAIVEHQIHRDIRIVPLEGHHDAVEMLRPDARWRVDAQIAFHSTHVAVNTFERRVDGGAQA